MDKGNKVNNLYILLLFLIITAFFIPFFFNSSLLTIKDNDLGRTYIPIFSFIKESFLKTNQIPLWRTDQMTGESLIGNPISTLLYPANLIFIFFPVSLGSIIYLYFHLLLACFSTYLLAKNMGMSKKSSFLASLFFCFSTKMLLHIVAGHITMVAAFCYFPLIFLLTRVLINEKSKIAAIVLSFPLAFSYMLHATVFYYTFAFCLIYIFYRLIRDQKPFHFLKTRGTHFLYSGFIFLGLISIILFPQMEFAKLSTRIDLKLTDVALPIWNLKRFISSLIFPYFYINSLDQESILYLGIIPSALAILGFLKLSKFQKTFLAIFGILVFLFVAGSSTPFFKIAFIAIPFLKYSRITTRIWFVIALLASLLAAYGTENIKNKTIIFVLILLFFFETLFISTMQYIKIPDLEFTNQQIYQYLSKDKNLFRVYCTTYCFNPQLLSKYNIEMFAGESPIQEKEFVDFLQNAGNYKYSNFAVIFPPYQVWQIKNPPQPNARLLGLANVKYIASTYQLNDSSFKYINNFSGILLYYNTLFKNRIYFENSKRQAQILIFNPNTVIIKVSKSNTLANLQISEKFYPGWVASGNGFSIGIQKNGIFSQISVPDHADYIKMEYRPETLILGKTITFGTLIFVILYSFRKRQKWQI